jgi:hypothetical protein
MKELEAHGLTPDRANYELVYTALLNIHDRQTNLHKIFAGFQAENAERPADYAARSVSVSDVIVLQWRGEVSAHFVDSVGFKELANFTGEERPQSTFLQVEKRPDTTSVDKLTADVKSGKVISLMDLSRAVNNTPKQTPSQKSKPSILAGLEESKILAAQHNNKSAGQKSTEREVE